MTTRDEFAGVRAGIVDTAVLHEHSIGDPRTWGADYAGFARAKAKLAWRLGHDSQHVQDALCRICWRAAIRCWGVRSCAAAWW